MKRLHSALYCNELEARHDRGKTPWCQGKKGKHSELNDEKTTKGNIMISRESRHKAKQIESAWTANRTGNAGADSRVCRGHNGVLLNTPPKKAGAWKYLKRRVKKRDPPRHKEMVTLVYNPQTLGIESSRNQLLLSYETKATAGMPS